MSKQLDLSLERREDKIYDLVIDTSVGSFKQVNTFDTVILMSLFEERRADESEQFVNFLRRGWWGNELADVQGHEIGSKLWLLEQATATTANLNLAVSRAQESLQWLVDDGFLDEVTVSGTLEDSSIFLTIELIRDADIVNTFFFDIWENTIKNTTIRG